MGANYETGMTIHSEILSRGQIYLLHIQQEVCSCIFGFINYKPVKIEHEK